MLDRRLGWGWLFLFIFMWTSCWSKTAAVSWSASQSAASAGSSLRLRLLVDGPGRFRLVGSGPESPLPQNVEFACTSRQGLNGLSMQCAHGDVRADYIYRTDHAQRSKLIYYPRGKKIDDRLFYDCRVQADSAAAIDFQCQRGREVFPEPSPRKFVSPITPTVAGAKIPNFHAVRSASQGGFKLFRGMEPKVESHLDYLAAESITTILMFKQVEPGEVEWATTEFGKRVPGGKVKHIPFAWHNYPNFQTPCRQIVEALSFIKQHPRTYLHCTVGEDRTGALSGLVQLLDDPKRDLRELFHSELCEHGYASGNVYKPYKNVIEVIERDITPVFLKVAYLIRSGRLAWDRLDQSVCAVDPASLPAFSRDPLYKADDYVCGPSTLYGG